MRDVDTVPLTDRRAEAYKGVMEGKPFAFVAVTGEAPWQAALGLAVANSRGYIPIPLGWARYAEYEVAQDHADRLNKDVMGLNDEQATLIVISTMGGIRYHHPDPSDGAKT